MVKLKQYIYQLYQLLVFIILLFILILLMAVHSGVNLLKERLEKHYKYYLAQY